MKERDNRGLSINGPVLTGSAMLVAMAFLFGAATNIVEGTGTGGRDSGPSPASIVIVSVDVSPNGMNDVAKDSVAMFRINVVLHNEGETNGTVQLRITGMKGVFANESIVLAGNGTAERTYDWKLQGDRRHTSTVTITGDVGSPSNMPAAADLHYKAAAPGFGALLLAGALAGTAVAIRGRRMSGRMGMRKG